MEPAKTLEDIRAFDPSSLRARATPKGTVLITSRKSNLVRVFDRETRSLTDVVTGHQTQTITDIAVNADEHVFLTAGDDSICVYDLETFELVRTINNHTDTVLSVDSSDKIIISGGMDFQLLVSSLTDGSRITKLHGTTSRLTGNQTWVSNVCACPALVIAGFNNGEIFGWDTKDWLLRRKLVLDGGPPILSLFAVPEPAPADPNPDSSYLVMHRTSLLIGTADGMLRRYDMADGTFSFNQRVGSGPDGGVVTISLANVSDKDGNSKGWPLVVTATAAAWYVYDTKSGRQLYEEECACTFVSPGFSGNTCFVCDASGHFRIVDIDTIVDYWL